MLPRRQLPNQPWEKFLRANHLVLHLPPDMSVQSFEGSSGAKRRPLGETDRFLRALQQGQITVTPMNQASSQGRIIDREKDM
jgi:hypothetical protein